MSTKKQGEPVENDQTSDLTRWVTYFMTPFFHLFIFPRVVTSYSVRSSAETVSSGCPLLLGRVYDPCNDDVGRRFFRQYVAERYWFLEYVLSRDFRGSRFGLILFDISFSVGVPPFFL